jgi:hypothetical protein
MVKNTINAGRLTLERQVELDPFDVVTYEDADYFYICKAEPGTSLSTSEWKVSRVKKDGTEVKQAGEANFKHKATDLLTVQGLF